MSREDLHFRLRIPEDLKKKVKEAADKNHRSMTAEIVARLKESFPPDKDEIARIKQGVQSVREFDDNERDKLVNALSAIEDLIDLYKE